MGCRTPPCGRSRRSSTCRSSCRSCPDLIGGCGTWSATRSRRSSSSSPTASPTPTATGGATTASSTRHGFAPPNWPWEERYRYQKQVYSNLERCRIGSAVRCTSPCRGRRRRSTTSCSSWWSASSRVCARSALSAEGAGVRGARPRSHERAAGVNSSVPTEDSQPDGQRSGATSNSGASTKRSA